MIKYMDLLFRQISSRYDLWRQLCVYCLAFIITIYYFSLAMSLSSIPEDVCGWQMGNLCMYVRVLNVYLVLRVLTFGQMFFIKVVVNYMVHIVCIEKNRVMSVCGCMYYYCSQCYYIWLLRVSSYIWRIKVKDLGSIISS